MWRQIFLFLVADMAAKLKDSTNEDEEKKSKEEVMFLLEQPSDPKDYMPSCVSFWGTEEASKCRSSASPQPEPGRLRTLEEGCSGEAYNSGRQC